MSKCSFCGETVHARGGRICLCARCREQLAALRPDSPEYIWYLRAVRRAMLGA